MTTHEAAPEQQAQPQVAHQPVHAGDYDSNPFTTALAGLKRLRDNGGSQVVAVFVVEILICCAGVIAMLIALICGAFVGLKALIGASGANSEPIQNLLSYVPQDAASKLLDFDSGALITTAVIFSFAAAFAFLITQAMQLAGVGTAVADNQKVQFKAVFKLAVKRMWPVAGYALLWLFVAAGCIALPIFAGFLFNAFGSDTAILGAWILLTSFYSIAVVIFFVYVGLRLSFTELTIVLEGKSLRAALRNSWELSKGHVIEIMGIGAAVTAGVYAVTIVTDLLGTLSSAASILGALITLALGLLGMAGIAERFRQIRAARASGLTTHKTNILLNLAAVVLAIALGGVSSAITQSQSTTPETPNGITRPAGDSYDDGRNY